MYTPKSNVTPALVLGLAAVVGLAGCASTKEMESLQAELAAVKTTAEQAGQEASEAKAAAQSAQRTADQALDTANRANDKAEETESKIDRMFKKAMYK